MSQIVVFLLTALTIVNCSGTKFSGQSKAGKPDPANTETDPVDTKKSEDSIQSGEAPKTVDGVTNSKNTVVFGETGVYRVGDGEAQATSCQMAVFSYELEGNAYSFLFNVEQDNTTISFEVGKICGIDSEDSNSILVVDLASNKTLASAVLDKRVVNEGEAPLAPFTGSVVFNKGKHSIQVVSDFRRGPGSDRDDYIIGNIKLKADKPIFGTGIETK